VVSLRALIGQLARRDSHLPDGGLVGCSTVPRFPGFMKVWVAKVCAKAEIEKKAKHKNTCFRANFLKNGLEKGNPW
jgi:hypothetical protein